MIQRNIIKEKVREKAADVETYALKQVVKQIPKVLPRLSDESIIKLLDLGEKVDDGRHKETIRNLKKAVEKKHPGIVLAKRVLKNASKDCKERLLINFFVNGVIVSGRKRREFGEKYGFEPPMFLLLNPSMRCNYNCIGCYTGKYSKEEELSFELLDRILKQGKEIGIHFYVVSGGEPFIRKDLLTLFKKHEDCFFLVYTNGSLIDKELAKKLAKLGNVAPGISVEGFREQTDARRGKGAFDRVLRAMANLKEAGVIFGYSATATRYNTEIIASEEFVDFFIKRGCSFAWYFQFVPVGKDPELKLMPTPDQRSYLRKEINRIRNKKPIFMGDFWNDGCYTGGCLSCGRYYLSINSKGDIEPCGFVHFAVDNIKNKPLKEAIGSDFFRALRAKQPFSKNLLMPCMIIDEPKVLRDACVKYKAYPTHAGAEDIIHNKNTIKFLNSYSKEMHKLTDKIWEKEYSKK